MGTDIYIVVERAVKGKWIAVETLNALFSIDPTNPKFLEAMSPVATLRNYRRFAALAGVRGGGAGPVPRGLPPDASDTTRYLFGELAGHSHSWLPGDEAVRVFLETEQEPIRPLVSDDPEYVYFNIGSGDLLNEHRIIFWFES